MNQTNINKYKIKNYAFIRLKKIFRKSLHPPRGDFHISTFMCIVANANASKRSKTGLG